MNDLNRMLQLSGIKLTEGVTCKQCGQEFGASVGGPSQYNRCEDHRNAHQENPRRQDDSPDDNNSIESDMAILNKMRHAFPAAFKALNMDKGTILQSMKNHMTGAQFKSGDVGQWFKFMGLKESDIYEESHQKVSCSQCGQDFGPGEHGFSHCEDHEGMHPVKSIEETEKSPDHELEEKAPPGMEDLVMKLKKEYPGHPEKAFATAWSIHNKKHGKTEEGCMMEDEGKMCDMTDLKGMFGTQISIKMRMSPMSQMQMKGFDGKEYSIIPHGTDQYEVIPVAQNKTDMEEGRMMEDEGTLDHFRNRLHDLLGSFVEPQEAFDIIQQEMAEEGIENEDAIMATLENEFFPDDAAHSQDFQNAKFGDLETDDSEDDFQDAQFGQFVEEDFDLNNGYDEIHHANGDDYFPTGADSPVTKSVGPSGARQGDNPEQKKMQVAEVHKELVYGYRSFLKESKKK